VSPLVFVVRQDYEQAVFHIVRAVGLPIVGYLNMFSPYFLSAPLLDGVITASHPYGFPAGLLPEGVRVIGHRPMRLLCALFGLNPPSRTLTGEARVPDTDELLTSLDEQKELPRATLEAQAQKGLGINDSTDLLVAVWLLFGEDHVPMDDPRLKGRLPARGSWGNADFTIADSELLQRHGVELADAKSWRDLGCDAEETIRLQPLGQNAVAPWLRAGIPPKIIDDEIHRWELTDALALIDAGCPPALTAAFLRRGLDMDTGVSYLDAGLDWRAAATFADAGLLPEEAKRWSALGVSPHAASTMHRLGGTIDEIRRLLAKGLDVSAVMRALREKSRFDT
jgi:hypothetical protein